MRILELWGYILYIAPLCFSILYFTLLETEDINKVEKTFTEDKLSYIQCIGLCFIPLLNILITLVVIKNQFID